jgi:hypothetical protein
MKKFFRFLGILVLILILVVVVMGLIAPKDVTIERSVVIKGNPSVVKEQMFMYKNFNNWNPFDDEDPNVKSEVIGEEGTPGSKYTWDGNDKVGKGEMITKEVTANEKKYTTHFIEPMEGKSDGWYRVEDLGNGETKATWGFTMHSSFPMNGISMMMGMEKMLTASFDKGLNSLKEYVESGKAGAGTPSVAIQEVQYPGATYATIRKTVGWNDLGKYFQETYSTLGQAAGQRIAGPAMAIYYKWDEQNQQADVAGGFPVSGTDAVKGAAMVTLPASQAYMVAYTGGPMGSGKIHEALGTHLSQNGKELSTVLEEYITSYDKEPDTNKHLTNIYYLIK